MSALYRKGEALDNPTLNPVRNVGFGFDEKIAGDHNDPFIGAATGAARQFGLSGAGDVYADDGEITGFQFKNVRAVVQSHGLSAVGVGVWADAT